MGITLQIATSPDILRPYYFCSDQQTAIPSRLVLPVVQLLMRVRNRHGGPLQVGHGSSEGRADERAGGKVGRNRQDGQLELAPAGGALVTSRRRKRRSVSFPYPPPPSWQGQAVTSARLLGGRADTECIGRHRLRTSAAHFHRPSGAQPKRINEQTFPTPFLAFPFYLSSGFLCRS
jgi:hypothetical protein